MERYLVGGAVRDEILGRRIGDRDWLVVGATQADMLARGFIRVGKSFPVFLHPDTKEEHALARVETKTGVGHKGFDVKTAGVGLEADLRRRDLTINAMAKDEAGNLYDPFGGYQDLKEQVLRHVSSAFVEDPLRVYRTARFASELPSFRVASETSELMRSMRDELSALSGERVWREFERGANAKQPARFFEVVAEAHVQEPWFRDFDLCGLAELIRDRGLNGDGVFGAIGWLHNFDVVAGTLKNMKSPVAPVTVAEDICRYGRLVERLLKTGGASAIDPEEVLQAFVHLHAFRPGERANRTLAILERLVAVSMDPVRELIAHLCEVSTDSTPGPKFGRALHRKRRAFLENAMGHLPCSSVRHTAHP